MTENKGQDKRPVFNFCCGHKTPQCQCFQNSSRPSMSYQALQLVCPISRLDYKRTLKTINSVPSLASSDLGMTQCFRRPTISSAAPFGTVLTVNRQAGILLGFNPEQRAKPVIGLREPSEFCVHWQNLGGYSVQTAKQRVCLGDLETGMQVLLHYSVTSNWEEKYKETDPLHAYMWRPFVTVANSCSNLLLKDAYSHSYLLFVVKILLYDACEWMNEISPGTQQNRIHDKTTKCLEKLTSSRQFFRIYYFCSIFLSGGFLDTSSNHRKGTSVLGWQINNTIYTLLFFGK